MKRLLNTLYVMTQGSYLRKEGEAIIVRVGDETRLRLPILTIGSIICFGDVFLTPSLIGHCAQNGVTISYLSFYGRFLARVMGPTSGNVLLRREQYRVSDDRGRSALIARTITAAKIANSRSVLLRALRDHGDVIASEDLECVCAILKRSTDEALAETDLDRLRGLEGDAARSYYSVFNELIRTQKADFIFTDRNRRPPLDRVNCLLSFVYIMVYHDMRSPSRRRA